MPAVSLQRSRQTHERRVTMCRGIRVAVNVVAMPVREVGHELSVNVSRRR